jgi:hypothetical protein
MSMTPECRRLISLIADVPLWRDTYPDGPDIAGRKLEVPPDDIRAARSIRAAADAAWQPTHRHRKTGVLYRIVTEGWIESSKIRCVVYEDKDHCTWVRPASDFYDGRFQSLPIDPVTEPQP